MGLADLLSKKRWLDCGPFCSTMLFYCIDDDAEDGKQKFVIKENLFSMEFLVFRYGMIYNFIIF